MVPEQALQGQEEDHSDEAANAAGEGKKTTFHVPIHISLKFSPDRRVASWATAPCRASP